MDQVKIGKFITYCRKEKKLTQEQLAENLGVTSKSISRWENGKTMPDYSLLKDLCNNLGISINELLTGERIKESDYMNKAEENFINLKKKVDRVLKITDILSKAFGIFFIFLFILHTYFNWLYRGPWDDSEFYRITKILLIPDVICLLLIEMLNYEVKK